MKLITREVVSGSDAEAVWQLYTESFEGLRTAAVQRHVMYRHEFDEVMADSRITKLFVIDESKPGSAMGFGAERHRLAGIATLTNELTAVPLISPDYFAARWPELHADRRIFYVGFVAVHPDYQGTGAVVQLCNAVCEQGADRGGVVALDICAYNEETMALPTAVLRLSRAYTPDVKLDKMDAQTYWAYEFPVPQLPVRPATGAHRRVPVAA